LEFSAIDKRAPLPGPDGARIILWPVFALEVWDIGRAMARTVLPPPQHQPLIPDVPNWSWHEYGMRVGFWRLKRMFRELDVSPTVTLNARVCLEYPDVATACKEMGWELNAHAYEQLPMHKLEDQRASIFKTMDVIERFSGKRPRGSFGPGLTQTFDTIDYLAEAGIQYIGDWVLDDQPCVLQTKHAPASRTSRSGTASTFSTGSCKRPAYRSLSGAHQRIERQAVAAQEGRHDRHPIARAAGVREDEVAVGAEARQQRVFGGSAAALEALEPEL